jgi:hypothetical protein
MTSDVSLPPPTIELLEEQLAAVQAILDQLLEHLQIQYHDINAGGGVLFLGWNPDRWAEPKDGAQRYVGKARRAWETLRELSAQAVRTSAPERAQALEEADELLRRIIEQDDRYGAPGSTIEEVRTRVESSLHELFELLKGLPSAHEDGGKLLVPDTNALLFKPDLTRWQPPGRDWTIVLVPQVLRELDSLKLRKDVGDKAASIIRRVKDLGRRGDTFDGVPIVGSLRLREVAIDADMTDTLPWLRAGHGDDELLASVLELRCRDLNAVVALATRDRNLQNKARLARCPYLDVEDEL